MARIGKACSTLNTTLPFRDSFANRIGGTAVTFDTSSKLEEHSATLIERRRQRNAITITHNCAFANNIQHDTRWSPGLTPSNVR
jgi:hypothetical protein